MPPANPFEGPLQKALMESVVAVSIRASEGQSLLDPIAKFLDQHRTNNQGLPQHLREALEKLGDEFAMVATNYFRVYVSGSTPNRTYAPRASLCSPNPPTTTKTTYAKAVSTMPNAIGSHKDGSSAMKVKTTQKHSEDNRLFVRHPQTHPARNMYIYAIYTSLKTQLKAHGAALKRNTTYKLRPNSLS